MRVLFVADTHFGDSGILRYENRPFASTDEMDSFIIRKWNDTVAPEDKVFVAGDFSMHDKDKTTEICRSLNGEKFLIIGNHDTYDIRYYLECGFCGVSPYPVIYEGFYIISHEPLYINKNMPYANIFGHVHGNPIYADVSEQSFCVSLERTDYAPVDFEIIKKRIHENFSGGNDMENNSQENKKLSIMSHTFECTECHKTFKPTTKEYLSGIHTVTRRLLECPYCKKKIMCRPVTEK